MYRNKFSPSTIYKDMDGEAIEGGMEGNTVATIRSFTSNFTFKLYIYCIYYIYLCMHSLYLYNYVLVIFYLSLYGFIVFIYVYLVIYYICFCMHYYL